MGSAQCKRLPLDVKKKMKLINLKPTQAAWLLLGGSIGLHFVVPDGYRGDFACPACGAVTIGLGFGLMMWAWWLFRHSGTPIRPTDRATFLVVSGAFRISRNPMYLGILLMLAGVAIWVGSLPMMVAPVGFVILTSIVFIPYEEQRLREAFGAEYEAYARKVRRWL